jgi:hypothetical protein
VARECGGESTGAERGEAIWCAVVIGTNRVPSGRERLYRWAEAMYDYEERYPHLGTRLWDGFSVLTLGME